MSQAAPALVAARGSGALDQAAAREVAEAAHLASERPAERGEQERVAEGCPADAQERSLDPAQLTRHCRLCSLCKSHKMLVSQTLVRSLQEVVRSCRRRVRREGRAALSVLHAAYGRFAGIIGAG